MAQAGFYYQPSSTGDDRAMCFTCNVCLVCWEPTDEPWFVNIFVQLLIVHSCKFKKHRQTAVKQEMTKLSKIINKESNCTTFIVVFVD